MNTQKKKPSITKRKVRIVVGLLLGFVLLILLGIGWFFWALLNEKPPQFFPLDDTQAEYKLTKNCSTPQQKIYCLEYRGDRLLMKDMGNPHFFSILLGRSMVDLKEFEEKEVKNINGEFVYGSQQCIKGKCSNINGPHVVLDVNSLEIANR